jgi:hypothetical protein
MSDKQVQAPFEEVKAVNDVKADTSNWWNKLPKQVRDVVLVSAGVLGGIVIVRIAESNSEKDDSEGPDDGPDEGPVLYEMKQQMKAASKMAKDAKKMANKAIKNADKAIAAINGN